MALKILITALLAVLIGKIMMGLHENDMHWSILLLELILVLGGFVIGVISALYLIWSW